MFNEPISVLSGGNIGHTIAADLALSGYRVHFYEHPQFKNTIKATLEKKTIDIEVRLTGSREQAKIHKVTTDIEEAISGVRLIFLVTPALGQELFFNTMIPHLKDGQIVVLAPGNFGSLRLKKLLQDRAVKTKVRLCELSAAPYASRVTAPATVSVIRSHGFGNTWVTSQAPRVPPNSPHLISALPDRDAGAAIEEVQNIYPFYSPTRNVLISGLSNSNTILHPIASVLNAGRIEYANQYLNTEFRLHREGHTPAVQRVEDGIANELTAVIKALSGDTIVPEEMGKAYFERVQTEFTSAQPRTLQDRYITEDVPYGMVPISQLAKKLGVATPLTDAIIELASALNQDNYYLTGRTLESLGLAELNKDQIISLVENDV